MRKHHYASWEQKKTAFSFTRTSIFSKTTSSLSLQLLYIIKGRGKEKKRMKELQQRCLKPDYQVTSWKTPSTKAFASQNGNPKCLEHSPILHHPTCCMGPGSGTAAVLPQLLVLCRRPARPRHSPAHPPQTARRLQPARDDDRSASIIKRDLN